MMGHPAAVATMWSPCPVSEASAGAQGRLACSYFVGIIQYCSPEKAGTVMKLLFLL